MNNTPPSNDLPPPSKWDIVLIAGLILMAVLAAFGALHLLQVFFGDTHNLASIVLN